MLNLISTLLQFLYRISSIQNIKYMLVLWVMQMFRSTLQISNNQIVYKQITLYRLKKETVSVDSTT